VLVGCLQQHNQHLCPCSLLLITAARVVTVPVLILCVEYTCVCLQMLTCWAKAPACCSAFKCGYTYTCTRCGQRYGTAATATGGGNEISAPFAAACQLKTGIISGGCIPAAEA
jgi:hypothetical protein